MPSLMYSDDDIAEALGKLRAYTTGNAIPSQHDVKARHQYAIRGLRQTLPEALVPKDGFEVVKKTVDDALFLGAAGYTLAGGGWGSLLMAGARVMVGRFLLALPSQAKDGIRSGYRSVKLWGHGHYRTISEVVDHAGTDEDDPECQLWAQHRLPQ